MRKSYLKKRFLALLIDYIVIWIYLILLFLLFAVIYILFFDITPAFDETTSHLMSLFTTVLPARSSSHIWNTDILIRPSAKGGWGWK